MNYEHLVGKMVLVNSEKDNCDIDTNIGYLIKIKKETNAIISNAPKHDGANPCRCGNIGKFCHRCARWTLIIYNFKFIQELVVKEGE